MSLTSIQSTASSLAQKAKSALTGSTSTVAKSSLSEAQSKIKSMGVQLFNPMETMTKIKSSVMNEQVNILDMRKSLESMRKSIEKDAQVSDFKQLSSYTSSLQSRTQDSFSTAVTDGVIKELTAASIKNPLAGDMYETDADGNQTNVLKEKGFLEMAGDAFAASANLGLDLGASALDQKAKGTTAIDLNSTLAHVSEMNTIKIPEQNPIISNTVANVVNNKAESISTPINDAINNNKSANTILEGLTGAATKILATPINQASNSIITKDSSGAINDIVTQNTIKNVTESVSGILSKDVATEAVKIISDTCINVANNTDNVLNDTSISKVGCATSESIVKAINESATADAAAKGDTEAVAKSITEEKIIWCSGKKCCNSVAKTCSQTTKNVTNVLATAEILDIDLNTVKSNTVKTPDKSTNIAINETKPVGAQPAPEIEIDTYDLTEFKELIQNGSMLAKIVLGDEEYNRCLALLKAQEALMLEPALESTSMVA